MAGRKIPIPNQIHPTLRGQGHGSEKAKPKSSVAFEFKIEYFTALPWVHLTVGGI
jgi:hypothetical protein